MGVAHSVAADRGSALASYDLADHPVPTGREEAWRFTPQRRLRGLHDGTAQPAADAATVTVDAAPGVTVESVGRDDPRIGRLGAPDDRVEAQVHASFTQATVVSVPAEAVTTRPTTITVKGLGADGAGFTRVVVQVGHHAEAVVVLDHRGSGTHAETVEVQVGDEAKLTLVSIQDWDEQAVHVGRQRFAVGRNAVLRAVNATLGGDLVRIYASVSYDGPGGDAELFGVFLAGPGQHLEHRLFVEHGAPHCRSNVAYKGALAGAGARTVWVGDVLIRADAVGTDTYELNRNLLLTDGARADSVPNLEIETGEIVGAGHASATGRFDDEQLFYLQARGIPVDEARRLVVRGFFADLLQQAGVPEVEQRLMAAIDEELEQVRA